LSLNLIESHQDENKKNVKNLYLNDAGKALYRELIAAMDERSKQLEAVLSEDEQAVFFDLLARIENKTEALLAEQASEFIKAGLDAPTDQKELIRWHKKSNKKP